jgi:DNA replication protein DnaC
MIHEATIDKLLTMRLTAMADGYRNQIQDPSLAELTFADRFGLLVDQEYRTRKNNRLKRLIQQAGFEQSQAYIGGINYHPKRKLNKDQVQFLAQGSYLDDHHNIIILSAAGMGKSYLACAFGLAACQQFNSVKYIRLPELLADLSVARGEGVFKKAIGPYVKTNLLILDEWMLVSLKETEARDVLEIINARHKCASTIFCSQFVPAGWHGKIGDATLADAILDRIVHDSYTVTIESAVEDFSMREVYGIQNRQF